MFKNLNTATATVSAAAAAATAVAAAPIIAAAESLSTRQQQHLFGLLPVDIFVFDRFVVQSHA